MGEWMSSKKAFIRGVVIAFVWCSLIFGLYTAWRIDVWTGVKRGLLFGLIIASIGSVLMVIVYAAVKRVNPTAVAVQQERTLFAKASLDEVFSWCVEYLKVAGKFKDVAAFREGGTVKARTAMSFASWGEDISVTCRSLPDGRVEVEIRSQPRYRKTVIDYGKNLRNVETIANALQRRFHFRG